MFSSVKEKPDDRRTNLRIKAEKNDFLGGAGGKLQLTFQSQKFMKFVSTC